MKKAPDIDPLDREFSRQSLRGKGIRGKYAARLADGSNLVRLTPEIARIFPTEAAVNQALISLVELTKSISPSAAKARATKARAKSARAE